MAEDEKALNAIASGQESRDPFDIQGIAKVAIILSASVGMTSMVFLFGLALLEAITDFSLGPNGLFAIAILLLIGNCLCTGVVMWMVVRLASILTKR